MNEPNFQECNSNWISEYTATFFVIPFHVFCYCPCVNQEKPNIILSVTCHDIGLLRSHVTVVLEIQFLNYKHSLPHLVPPPHPSVSSTSPSKCLHIKDRAVHASAHTGLLTDSCHVSITSWIHTFTQPDMEINLITDHISGLPTDVKVNFICMECIFDDASLTNTVKACIDESYAVLSKSPQRHTVHTYLMPTLPASVTTLPHLI